MFGLSRREQRWKAEQKAAETLLGFAVDVLAITAHADLARVEQEHAVLLAENAALKEQIALLKMRGSLPGPGHTGGAPALPDEAPKAL